ncbi:MAG TPA: pur operon repressor [Limnochordia bacterium]|nr:pur operon repressor [Limnochordia bacterium]
MRRSARLAAMTKILVDRPNRIVSLSEFVERFGAAKSTVSEDLAIIRDVFAKEGLGRIETLTGAAGGVRYVPLPTAQEIAAVVEELCAELASPERILPGGFLYISDLVSSPWLTYRVGEIFAAHFHAKAPDAVVTLETRGIPIALMTARALDVPLAIVRRVNRVTEGTVVTTNYVSGSAKRIETMSLSRRALSPGMKVVIIDDFMKAGGSARGLVDLVGEFGAEVAGIGVLVETAEPRQKLVGEYVSLAVLETVDVERRCVKVRPSHWVTQRV